MKQFYLILFLCSSNFLFAQNYHLFSWQDEVFFEWKNTNQCYDCIYPAKVDSVYTIGADSVFQHLRLNNGNTRLGGNPFGCWTIRDSSHFGREIIIQSDFTFLFFNGSGDSIFIKPALSVGQSWIAYRFSGLPNYIEAQVASISWENVFGTLDSVKTINFTLKDSLGNTISSPINALNINVSQHFGMVKSLSFLTFPNDSSYLNLVGHSGLNAPIRSINWSDIYDFNVNDEFHIQKIWNGPAGLYYKKLYRDRIISKTISSTEYIYTIDRLEVVINQQITDTTFSSSIVTETYPLIHFSDNIIPRELLCSSNDCSEDYWNLDNKLGSDNYNGRMVKSINYSSGSMGDSCLGWHLGSVPPPDNYIEGAGGPYYFGGSSGHYEMRFLSFFQKGSEKWGVPIDFELFTSTQSPINDLKSITLLPNPVTDNLQISTNKIIENGQLAIFDANGQFISQQNINHQQRFNLDVHDYPNGIYILKITTENGNWSRKFVKQ